MGVAGISYDASAGIVQTAFQFTSTIIPMVLDGVEFWMLLVFNLAVCISRHMKLFDPEAYNLDLPWGLTGVTGSLMTFFVIFYNQHVFGRYNKLYDLTKLMCGHCIELVSVLRVQVPNKAVQRKIAKLVVTSVFMFFFERTESSDGKVSKKEYKQLKSLDMLGDNEIAHLQKHCKRLGHDALPSFLVLQWAMEIMRLETENPENRDDMLCGFYSRIFRVRNCQAEVVQILDLPMPFQYFHIMNLMLMLNLLLWAYSLGCQDSLFAPVIFMFAQMMFQGIRELSTALSDPFGEDEVDFPVNKWMMTLYTRVYAILEDPHDIALTDLSTSRPLLEPEKVMQTINMFVDLDVMESASEKETRLAGDSRTRRARTAGYREVSQDDYDEESGSGSEGGANP